MSIIRTLKSCCTKRNSSWPMLGASWPHHGCSNLSIDCCAVLFLVECIQARHRAGRWFADLRNFPAKRSQASFEGACAMCKAILFSDSVHEARAGKSVEPKLRKSERNSGQEGLCTSNLIPEFFGITFNFTQPVLFRSGLRWGWITAVALALAFALAFANGATGGATGKGTLAAGAVGAPLKADKPARKAKLRGGDGVEVSPLLELASAIVSQPNNWDCKKQRY